MKTPDILKSVYQKLFIIPLALLPATGVFAQEQQVSAYSLDQAIKYAITNQAEIKNAELEVEISRAKTKEIISIGMPQVNGSADVNHFIEIPTQFIPAEFFDGEPGTYAAVQFGQPYAASAGLNASQLLFDGTYMVGVQAAKTYVELSRKGLAQSKIDVEVNVRKAYWFVLVAEERYNQLTSDLARVGKLKDDTKAMFDNGFVEKIDYDRIELSYNLVENALSQTKRFVDNSYNVLKFQMGMDLKTPIALSQKIADINFDPSVLKGDSVNVESRIEYSILQTQYRLAEYDLKRYKALRWPSLVAFGNYTTTASRDEFNFLDSEYRWYPSSVIGAKLSLPILGGYKIGYQVRQAELNRKQVENSFYLMEQGIKLEHDNALNTLRSNVDKLNTQEKNRTLAREITRVSKIKYDQGVGSNLEVIDAETSLREAETNYYLALLETIISKIDLDKASGLYKY